MLNALTKASKGDSLPNFKHFKKSFSKAKENLEKSSDSSTADKAALGKRIQKNLKKKNYKTVRSTK
ncbi:MULTISPECIES: hypothetical protein [unclassified Helicobacter]|uniref:hypothetical protein n=1 Tax=unclassified Helicobacter TaxID=2593540 RepID=UPI001F312477|nr:MULTISPECIES: hypothetical protein [unclassified Helicobacter]